MPVQSLGVRIILTGCSNAATPTQAEDRPLLTVVETVPEPAGPVESEPVVLSASNDQFVDKGRERADCPLGVVFIVPSPSAACGTSPMP